MPGPDTSPSATADDAGSPDYSDHDHDDMADHEDMKHSHDDSPSRQTSGSGEEKPKSNAKDPQRPRRKKARRACFACQRAHLTCGDERPCQRCVKRGLAEACQDGVRKKAKYLHDAPNEALMPGVGGLYHHLGGASNNGLPTTATVQTAPMGQTAGFYQQAPPSNFDAFGPNATPAQGQMPPPPLSGGSFSAQSPISPQFSTGPSQQAQQGMAPSAANRQVTLPQMQPFGNPIFDPSDPAIYNFDLASLNFANNYGALEFGMLGHMSSGAADTPPHENGMGSLNQPNFNASLSASNYSDVFGQDAVLNAEWQNHPRQNSSGQLLQTPHNTPVSNAMEPPNRHESVGSQPHAFAIGAGPSSLASASPASITHDASYDSGPMSPAFFNNNNNNGHSDNHQQPHPAYPRSPQRGPTKPSITANSLKNHTDILQKRRRNAKIYTSVTQPYPYTAGFHLLTAVIHARFPRDKKIRIAKALASIRPSFISVTGTLDRDDLIFMEKSFQRALLEYENYVSAVGCPTLICRRTGEVATVSREFSSLTGWKKDVLLGKEPNLNVSASSATGNQSGTNSRGQTGQTTPRVANAEVATDPNKIQPVFIADVLDDDSVCTFYDDFARLAFSDSHGTAMRPCKLLKYRTKDDLLQLDDLASVANGNHVPKMGMNGLKNIHSKSDQSIIGEHGMNALASKDGKIDCMMTWSVKRDLFEVPMMIVINFLPCIR